MSREVEIEIVKFGPNKARAIVFEVVEMSVFIHPYRDGRDFRWVEENNQCFPVMELRAFDMHQPIITTALSQDFAYALWKTLHREPREAVNFKAGATPSQVKQVRWPRKQDLGNLVTLTASLIIPQWKRIVETPKLTPASLEQMEKWMREWAAKHEIRL